MMSKSSLGKTAFTLICTILLTCGVNVLQGQHQINKLFGTYGAETGVTGFVMPDSSIYALGTSSAFVAMSSQVYLIKIDKTGNIIWSKFYGGTGVDKAVDMVYDGDTSVYVAVNAHVGGGKGYDVKVYRLNLNGDVIWEKNYGTLDWDIPSRLTLVGSDEMAVCGHTYGGSYGLADAMILRLNTSGDSLGFNVYGTPANDYFYDLGYKTDTLVAVGEITNGTTKKAWGIEAPIPTGVYNAFEFSGAYNYTYNALDIMPNGNYFIGLTTDSLGSGAYTTMVARVCKAQTHAQILQMIMYSSNNDYCSDVKFKNNYYHILGNTSSFGLGGFDPIVYRFDLGGWFYSGSTYGTTEDDYGTTIFPNNNATYTIVGTSQEMYGVSDLWVVNVDTFANVYAALASELDVNSVQENQTEITVQLYPNPVHETLTVVQNSGIKQMFLFDISGKQVCTVNNTNKMDVAKLSNGAYYLRGLTLQDKPFSAKIIKY